MVGVMRNDRIGYSAGIARSGDRNGNGVYYSLAAWKAAEVKK